MSTPTNFPDMLDWLIQNHPRLADEWVGQRTQHGYACPDLEEWLGIKAAYELAQYREWAASQQEQPEPAPIPEDPEGRQALLAELEWLITSYNQCVENVEAMLADLRVAREGIDSILARL